MSIAGDSAFEVLCEFERRARDSARGLPSGKEVYRGVWRGLGFRIADQHLVVEIHEVGEVLPYPQMTRVPGAKAWVSGVANVRGRLLPVMDLRAYVLGEASAVSGMTRVLVAEREGFPVGLVVEALYGLKQFFEDQRSDSPAGAQSWLAPYARGRFVVDDKGWTVFDIAALLGDPAFQQAAA